jgi:predicted transposase/invertase (TIGR01784 family)
MAKHLVRFDWAIKKLLRSKANFVILEGFLSELLKRDLKIVSILESEGNKHDQDGKSNKVDILVKLENTELVLIEVQVNTELDYFYRMLFGTSKIVTEYLKQGDPYANIKKIYSVNILYFDLGHGVDYIYHGTTSFIGLHQGDKLDLSEKQKSLYQKDYVHQIYPEYYLIKVNQFNDVAKDTLDEWIYFLKNEEIKDSFHAKGLSEAKEALNEMKLPEAEKQAYEKYLDNLRYQNSMFNSSFQSGKFEGEKVGLEKGEKLGKIKIAKKMKAAGLSNEIIHQVTGLTEGEIKKSKIP